MKAKGTNEILKMLWFHLSRFVNTVPAVSHVLQLGSFEYSSNNACPIYSEIIERKTLRPRRRPTTAVLGLESRQRANFDSETRDNSV